MGNGGCRVSAAIRDLEGAVHRAETASGVRSSTLLAGRRRRVLRGAVFDNVGSSVTAWGDPWVPTLFKGAPTGSALGRGRVRERPQHPDGLSPGGPGLRCLVGEVPVGCGLPHRHHDAISWCGEPHPTALPLNNGTGGARAPSPGPLVPIGRGTQRAQYPHRCLRSASLILRRAGGLGIDEE
jgi:hypothetical protein